MKICFLSVECCVLCFGVLCFNVVKYISQKKIKNGQITAHKCIIREQNRMNFKKHCSGSHYKTVCVFQKSWYIASKQLLIILKYSSIVMLRHVKYMLFWHKTPKKTFKEKYICQNFRANMETWTF